jgi:hypothetical protein
MRTGVSPRAKRTPTCSRRDALYQAIERARQRITRGTEMLTDGDIARDRYDAVCTKAEVDISAAEAELATLSGETLIRPLPDLDGVLARVGGWAQPLY